jgi:hypothetical protein
MHGHFDVVRHESVPSCVVLDEWSLKDLGRSIETRLAYVPGELHVTNTFEEFRKINMKQLLDDSGYEILRLIQSGEAIRKPYLLNQLILITWPDIKNHKFTYWFCHPKLNPPIPFLLHDYSTIDNYFTPNAAELESLKNAIQCFSNSASQNQSGCGGMIRRNGTWGIHSLQTIDEMLLGNVIEKNIDLCILILETSPLSSQPGSMLQNLLMLCSIRWNLNLVRIVSVRKCHDTPSRSSLENTILTVEVPNYGKIDAINLQTHLNS